MINSSAQRAKWTDQTAPSSEQTPNWSIERASSKVKTALYLLVVQRGQGRAAGAAEDHMKCLVLLQTS